jgi:L(+)-tartrate dehydratase beta subunit
MSGKKILTTPVKAEDLEGIKAGDMIYLNGHIVTCRDVAHRRFIEGKQSLPVDIKGKAIYHAGPIIRSLGNDKFQMVAIGATTSMRMEKFEYEFVKQSGVRIIIGKGGMGEGTRKACMEFKSLFVVYPAGCAVCAAAQVEEIEQAEWRDLEMPETLWVCRVKELGPLIVSIDTYGNNLYEQNMVVFNRRKEVVYNEIAPQVSFIK